MADTTPDAALPGLFDRRPSLQEALADEPRWALILRGIAALMLGMIAFLMPGITFLMLIAIFAGYMLVDGILAIASGWRAGREGQRWWPFLIEGMANLLVGVLALLLTAGLRSRPAAPLNELS